MSRRWAVLGAALAVVAIALTFKPAVEGDGVGYFAYLHSTWVDHDLDLADEYAAAFAAHVDVVPAFLTTRTATGLLADFFPVGPAVLASPLYLAALVLHPDGRPVFGPPFTTAFDLASLLFGLLGLALTYRLARPIAGARAAAIGTLAVATASPFAYYVLFEPSYSHTFSAFAVALFLLAWRASGECRSALGWFGLGVLGGLMGAVRFQDGPLAAIALLDAPAARRRALAFFPGVALGFLPQVVVDRVLFATWLPVRPAGQDLQPWAGHYLDVLFSSNHGLFAWSPLLLVACVGALLVPAWRWRAAFVFAFLAEIVIDGAAPDWSGGFAFGARRLLDLTPFFGVGLAVIAARLGPRLAAAGAAVVGAWTLVLIANLTYVQRADIDPGYVGLVRGQATALRWVPNLFGQGAAGRDLLWWPLLHQGPDLTSGGVIVALIVLCVAAALWVAQVRRPAPVTSG